VTSQHCCLCTGLTRTNHHAIFSAKLVKRADKWLSLPSAIMRIALSFSAHFTQNVDQTTNSSSVAHPHFWQQHTAAGRHTFSIHNVTLSKPEMNNGHTKLPTTCTAWMTPTVHLFSSWWHIQHFFELLALQRLFYGFPDHCRCCSISQHTQPFYAIQMPCHN
jgi:hypothetical protein